MRVFKHLQEFSCRDCGRSIWRVSDEKGRHRCYYCEEKWKNRNKEEE